jgi:hypothetical protein
MWDDRRRKRLSSVQSPVRFSKSAARILPPYIRPYRPTARHRLNMTVFQQDEDESAVVEILVRTGIRLECTGSHPPSSGSRPPAQEL